MDAEVPKIRAMIVDNLGEYEASHHIEGELYNWIVHLITTLIIS